jgi:hypothetical protein
MAYLTVLNSRIATPSAILAQWMQNEAEQANLKAKRTTVENDPYQARQRIAAAHRAGIEPPVDAVALTDYRALFISAVLDAVNEHLQASRGGHGDVAKHTACIQAWRLAAKAAQVGMTFDEVGRFVKIAQARSEALVLAARKARRSRRAA